MSMRVGSPSLNITNSMVRLALCKNGNIESSK